MRIDFILPERRALVSGEFPKDETPTVWEAAHRLGVPLPVPCGGQGLCGKCAVRIEPAPAPSPREQALLTPDELQMGVRLACVCRPVGEALIRVERTATAPVVSGGGFPERIPVDPGRNGVGLACDVGTTNLSAGCVDLATGAVLATAEAANPQARYGEDVLARLGYALKGSAAREELRRAVGEGLERLAAKVTAEACRLEEVREVVLVGNPAMHHLLLGLEVSSLAAAPHRPAVVSARLEDAGSLGLGQAGVAVYLPPLVGGFVGSDATAVAVAEGLLGGGGCRLAVDLGTNGELVLVTPAGVYACSTAAGPAFEGAGLRCGMRAEPGAVIRVEPGTPLAIGTVEGSAGRGLAGSGALAALATLLALGGLAPNGRLRSAEELDGGWPGLAGRLVTLPGELRAVVLVPPAESATGEPVLLTQADIRSLQLAKGAVRAGVDLLLRRAGVDGRNLDEVILAGAFGNGLVPEHALATGLLPPLPAERLRVAGKAAWTGAAMLLGQPSLRLSVEEAVRRVMHLPLAEDPDFAAAYLSALDFPGRERVE